ncbi:TPA: carbon storage regulator [Legionella pneumophila]|uniref:Carbon storage regulator n=1 Tax=Legionella pneumophila TaxID=446 RepID=A0A378K742_LEGPN|nr:carbon storage regulator [Legionella pneumophila]MCZ4682006.1 carbon storage regulator [Legionella pneumophila]MCZ4689329.1 carbon storage regulator [Legionella pneumophila]MCZ4708114.1 carbon storage regulator [Legionella pneumophila]MCZ4717280.1 carbon storage regulator [Legionella pneumophila]MCZ4738626.1 carbon storage regulator [Legionella pneumophila]
MLILDRKIGEEIYINKGKIKITVLYEKNGLIGIGVRAPSYIDIDRKEVFIRKFIQKLDQENKSNQS